MIFEEKKLIRNTIKTLLSKYKNNFSTYSEIIFNLIIESQEFKNADTILSYMALNDEVTINNTKLSLCKNVFIPKVYLDSGEMDFFKFEQNNMEKGAYDIFEPKSTNIFQIENLHKYGNILILVPGRAFTINGKRLGRGKGYYDKFLHKLFSKFEIVNSEHSITTFGICFPQQIIPQIPTEDFDINMDKIITIK